MTGRLWRSIELHQQRSLQSGRPRQFRFGQRLWARIPHWIFTHFQLYWLDRVCDRFGCLNKMSVIYLVRLDKLSKIFLILSGRWDAFWTCENRLLTSLESIYNKTWWPYHCSNNALFQCVCYQIQQIEILNYYFFFKFATNDDYQLCGLNTNKVSLDDGLIIIKTEADKFSRPSASDKRRIWLCSVTIKKKKRARFSLSGMSRGDRNESGQNEMIWIS